MRYVLLGIPDEKFEDVHADVIRAFGKSLGFDLIGTVAISGDRNEILAQFDVPAPN